MSALSLSSKKLSSKLLDDHSGLFVNRVRIAINLAKEELFAAVRSKSPNLDGHGGEFLRRCVESAHV